jgi:putative ABC transport system permease protein
MFFRFILRALQYRKQRLILAFAALAVAATLATVLFGIYGSVARRLHDEFRAYGANIMAVPANGGTIPLDIVTAAEKQGALAAPFLITTAKDMVIAGFVPDKTVALTPYWNVRGNCLAGQDLNVSVGQTVQGCVVQGILKTGGPEDNELMVPYKTAEEIAGLTNSASVIEIRAPGDRLEQIRNALAAAYPIAQFRTVRSVADTETNVIFKIRAALFLLTLLILTITTLCVSSNFSEMVIERSKEIGILKALGAAERRIAAFFVSESAALALVATIVGYVVGLFAAAAIGKEIFGGVFRLQADWFVFLVVAAVMLGVAAIATVIATSRIWNIQAAVILRGE